MSTALTSSMRSLRARRAAAARWSQPGAREAHAAKIKASRLAHHENRIDPDGALDPVERRKLARQSLQAEMLGLALRSAQARRLRKGAA